MSLILILALVLVVLVVIDFYRKAQRQKQKELIANKQREEEQVLATNKQTSAETSSGDVAEEDVSVVEYKEEYANLKDGFIILYYDSAEMLQAKDLNSFFSGYGIRFVDGIFQKMNYKDVIYTILPDNDGQSFDSAVFGEAKSLIAVMNYQKVIELGYDARVCYEFMLDMLENMVNNFGGILMNENKMRLTKRDKQKYLEATTL